MRLFRVVRRNDDHFETIAALPVHLVKDRVHGCLTANRGPELQPARLAGTPHLASRAETPWRLRSPKN
jgi:hypothetical protein